MTTASPVLAASLIRQRVGRVRRRLRRTDRSKRHLGSPCSTQLRATDSAGADSLASSPKGKDANRQEGELASVGKGMQEGSGADANSADDEEVEEEEEDDDDGFGFGDEEDILASLMGGAAGDEVDLLGDGTLIKSIITPAPKFTRRPQLGDEVTVHFVGTLEDGKVFDDSRKRGEPYKFNLGLEQVIKGFDKGVPTMMKGERALFTMTPEMAYGEAGAGWKIPKNATVRFDIELLGFDELDDMSSEFDEDDVLTYEEQEGIGRGDVGPGGEDPAGRYRWERRGLEVVVIMPLADDVVSQDIVGEFCPQRVFVSVKGETVLNGRPGCDLEWEECTWNIDTDFQGERSLFVHLQKLDALQTRWPDSLLQEDEGGGMP